MAGRSATTERVNWALELLMAGRDYTRLYIALFMLVGPSSLVKHVGGLDQFHL